LKAFHIVAVDTLKFSSITPGYWSKRFPFDKRIAEHHQAQGG
jgi:hypothetical protein